MMMMMFMLLDSIDRSSRSLTGDLRAFHSAAELKMRRARAASGVNQLAASLIMIGRRRRC